MAQQGKDPKTGQMRDVGPNEGVNPKTGIIYRFNDGGGCANGGIPAGLPLKNFTDFRPLKSIEAGTETIQGTDPPKTKTIFQHQFQADGDITQWQLRKSCHWILGNESGSNQGTGIIGMFVPEILSVNSGGTFEYKIISPGGNIIFWSRVNLCLTGMKFAGLTSVTLGPDRSVDWRTRKWPAPPSTSIFPKPDLPILVSELNKSNGQPTGKVMVYHHGLPQGVSSLRVQRAPTHDNPKLEPAWAYLPDTLAPTDHPTIKNLFSMKDDSMRLGMNYFYRLVAITPDGAEVPGPGLSILSYNKMSCRTIIETFVIDGKATVSHPDISIKGNDRLSYDEYASQYVLYPKSREETFLLCPPQIGHSGNSLDFWWFGPMYKMTIPNGSILRVIMDGLSFGTFTQKGRAAEWQFSYKTESVVWGVVSDIAGRMLQASPEGIGGGVTIVNAENINSLGTVATGRAQIKFTKGASAFLFREREGTVTALVTEDDQYTRLYRTTNGGKNWQVQKTPDGKDFRLWDGLSNRKIIDITKDKSGIIYILAEMGTSLTITSSYDNFENSYYIGTKKSSMYKFELAANEFGHPGISIVGSDHRYSSTNNGRNWIERDALEVG